MARRRVTVRRIDPWSVLKFSFLVHVVGLLVLLLTSVVAWYFVRRLELVETLCGLAESVSIQNCGVDADALFRAVATLGALGVVVLTGIAVFSSFLANLIFDLTGGVELTLLDDTPVRQPGTRARGGNATGATGTTGAAATGATATGTPAPTGSTGPATTARVAPDTTAGPGVGGASVGGASVGGASSADGRDADGGDTDGRAADRARADDSRSDGGRDAGGADGTDATVSRSQGPPLFEGERDDDQRVDERLFGGGRTD